MAKRGDNIHKRKDGRWEGRYKKGRRSDGTIQYGSVYGKSYTEVKKKLKDAANINWGIFCPSKSRKDFWRNSEFVDGQQPAQIKRCND